MSPPSGERSRRQKPDPSLGPETPEDNSPPAVQPSNPPPAVKEEPMTEIETVNPEDSAAEAAASAAAGAATGEASETTEAPAGESNGTTQASTTKSYKERMIEQGLDPSLGVPQELADMMRAAAKKQGDISVASWYRLAWADAVNAAGLTHTVTKEDGTEVEEPWQFDKSRLEEKKARASTKNLTPEEKEKAKQEKKVEQKEERDLVKQLLAEHRAKLAAARGQAPAPTATTASTSVVGGDQEPS